MKERIVSLMIVAYPESGKTELIKKYRENNGIIPMRRFSAYGLIEALRTGKLKPRFKKRLGHLLIYDFAHLLSFKSETVNSTIAFLDALTEEGLESEATYAIQPDAIKKVRGMKGGIIAVVNPKGFFTPRGKKRIKASLLKGGFFSRNILVTYDMGAAVLGRAIEGIVKGDYRTDKKYVKLITLCLPIKPTDISITEEQSKELTDLAMDIVDDVKEDLNVAKEEFKGIRLSKSLISLAKASALRDGRNKVNEKDIDRIRFLSTWMNLKMNKLKTKYRFYEGLD